VTSSIVLSHPAWRLPINVNVEEGESKQQLLQIRELSFRKSKVFVCRFWESRFKVV
jgi:hypothetical protein